MNSQARILQVYLTHRKALVAYAARIVGAASAEDVVQEAYLRLSAPRDGTTAGQGPIVEPAAYLYRMVRNLAVDWIRRKSVLPTVDGDGSVLESIASPDSSPEDGALLRDEIRTVELALASLPLRTRTAFELHRLHGYTLVETARELEISVTRVHQLVRQAITRCADFLDTAEKGPVEKPDRRSPSGPGCENSRPGYVNTSRAVRQPTKKGGARARRR